MVLGQSRLVSLLLTLHTLAACGDSSPPTPPPPPPPPTGSWTTADGLFLLETPPSQAEVKSLLGDLAREAQKQVPAEIQDAMKQHLSSYGFQSFSTLQFEPKDTADLLRMAAYEALFGGNLSVAVWLFCLAGSIKPQDALFLSDAGFALNEQGFYEQAKKVLLAAIAADPQLHSAYVNLAFAHGKLGKRRSAILYLRHAVAMQPRVTYYRLALGRMYREAGQLEQAYNELEEVRRADPENAEIKAELEDLPVPPPPSSTTPPPPSGLAPILPALMACHFDQVARLKPGTFEVAPDTITAKIVKLGNEQTLIEGKFTMTTQDAGYACTDCEVGCNGDEGCEAGCWATQCSTDQAVLGETLPKLAPIPSTYEAIFGDFELYMSQCALDAMVEHHSEADLEAAASYLESLAVFARREVRLKFIEIAERMHGFRDEVAAVCEQAGTMIEEFNADQALSQVSNKLSLDLCLDKVACIGINNSTVTVSGSVGIFAGKLSADWETGDWGVAVGLQAADPTGTAQAGIFLKFHSSKGVGLGTEVKIGGPVKLRLGADYYASTNM